MSVVDYLINVEGISPERLGVAAFGEFTPLSPTTVRLTAEKPPDRDQLLSYDNTEFDPDSSPIRTLMRMITPSVGHLSSDFMTIP